jgi:SAM-dependent methyltransferase
MAYYHPYFCRYALTLKDWAYLFKCDDDTYINIPRFKAFEPHGDYLGGDRVERDGVVFAGGGAGYFLSRRAVQIIAELPPEETFEDEWVGRVLAAKGIACSFDHRFVHGDRQPRPPIILPHNDTITYHTKDRGLFAACHRGSCLHSIEVETQYPIALASLDHTLPFGTKQDNNTSQGLLAELASELQEPYNLLDIGCSGGQFVVDCWARGNTAVGLEGSDYSLRHQRANWPGYHNKLLFLCDLTKPFRVTEDREPLRFDVVTAWEVMEHFSPDDLKAVLENLVHHMHEGSLFLASISRDTGDPHHLSAHLSEAAWNDRLLPYFHVAPYTYRWSPRDEARHNSRFLRAVRCSGGGRLISDYPQPSPIVPTPTPPVSRVVLLRNERRQRLGHR